MTGRTGRNECFYEVTHLLIAAWEDKNRFGMGLYDNIKKRRNGNHA